MANKQTVPAMELKGAMLKSNLTVVPEPVGLHREIGENSAAGMAQSVLEIGDTLLKIKKKTDYEQYNYEADNTIRSYREQMNAAGSMEEIDTIAKAMEDDLTGRFNDRAFGKNYWDDYGVRLLDAARQDTERLKAFKNNEFGKNSLNDMLANNQNMLAVSSGKKGEMLLDRGIKEIQNTPFLSAAEKENYRNAYLKTGVLNMALNDPDAAEKLAGEYFSDNGDELKLQIAETRRLTEEENARQNEEAKRQEYLARLGQATQYWQAAERGAITPAQLYVLTADDDKDMLWGMREERSMTPLADVYHLATKINNGEKLSGEEIRNAENNLISAYKQKKIGFETMSNLQTKLLNVAGGNNFTAEALFDHEAAELADKVLLKNTAMDNYSAGQAFMEQKAKFAFDVFDVYDSRKAGLIAEVQARGGVITPMVEKRLRQQAAEETASILGIKESKTGVVSFAELKRLLPTFYGGSDEAVVWRRFAEDAPYEEDKKALFKRIAAEERRKELNLPQFDTAADARAAGLEKGARFYLRGRLAVIS